MEFLIRVEVGIESPISSALLLFKTVTEEVPRLGKAKFENHSSKALFSASYRCYELISMRQIYSLLKQHQVGEVTSTFFTLDLT